MVNHGGDCRCISSGHSANPEKNQRFRFNRGDNKQNLFCVNQVIGALHLDFSYSSLNTYELVSKGIKIANRTRFVEGILNSSKYWRASSSLHVAWINSVKMNSTNEAKATIDSSVADPSRTDRTTDSMDQKDGINMI
jgi:hypothetical protein